MAPRLVKCEECDGTGEVEYGGILLTCSDCDGTGEVESDEDDEPPEQDVLRT